jgi:hypothetical protein
VENHSDLSLTEITRAHSFTNEPKQLRRPGGAKGDQMKFVILAAALALAGFAAQANASGCKEGEVAYFASSDSTYGGEGGAREYPRTCHNGAFFPMTKTVVKHAGCIEGEVGYFPVSDSTYGGEGGAPEVARTCHNGSFFPRTKGDVKHRSCIEGEISYKSVQMGGESAQQIPVVCHGGRFVDRY